MFSDKFIKRIKHGEMLPPFHGIAWINFQSNEATCMPVPFNLAAGMLRGAWIFAKTGHRGIYLNARAAYYQGLNEGKAQALNNTGEEAPWN
jgi:hypothetical protein